MPAQCAFLDCFSHFLAAVNLLMYSGTIWDHLSKIL